MVYRWNLIFLRAKFEKSKDRVIMREKNEVVHKKGIIIFKYSKIKGKILNERHRKVKFQYNTIKSNKRQLSTREEAMLYTKPDTFVAI